MKERPILFSGEMVRAILEGRKTQTRRVLNMALGDFDPSTGDLLPDSDLRLELRDGVLSKYLTPESIARTSWMPGEQPEPGWIGLVGGKGPGGRGNPVRCPYGEVGDELWVKETYRTRRQWDDLPPSELPCANDLLSQVEIDFEATPAHAMHGKIRPSIFMPRWASRINLEITGVRVERVQEISDLDAHAEGVGPCGHDAHRCTQWACSYQQLWDKINAKRGFGWGKNPWVWVVEFRRVMEGAKDL